MPTQLRVGQATRLLLQRLSEASYLADSYHTRYSLDKPDPKGLNMKAGKKIAAKAQRRGIMHANALEARKKKGVSDDRGFKAPGSMNKKKV